ncbi:MAG: PCRF domain-containing protein, partial [Candidatus Coproplasma sp.]
MTPKITEIYNKYLSLTQKLSDPAIPAGSEEWTKIAKEQSELMETATKYEEYLAESKKSQQAAEALKTETDPEMRELLNEEVYECKRRLEEIEGELKILLLPKDKNDDRNCIMEIRGGAGGEEAALFAGQLYQMYLHYCEHHRLKVEVVDENATELGG